jgi:hypothetical protein
MSRNSRFDPEPLQSLFANAYAVQESGIDTDALRAIVEIQGLIDVNDSYPDAAVRLAAEKARSLANADGTAIGILKQGRLVYEAGSGTASHYVGRSVDATFSASRPRGIRFEILRVEDADSDTRIQSAICRQFGAQSLLILPIYCEDSLSGVLQVFFSHAHKFSDAEVRGYWVLTGLLGDAMSSSTRQDNPATIATRSFVSEPQAGPVAETGETPMVRQWEEPQATSTRATGVWMLTRALDVGIAAVVLIAVVTLVLDKDRMATMLPPGGPVSKESSAAEYRVPVTSTKLQDPPGDSVERTAKTRHSVSALGKQPSHLGIRVKRFGDAVTVMYFTPESVGMRTDRGETEIRQVSDDVTVRHFQPRNLGAPHDQ